MESSRLEGATIAVPVVLTLFLGVSALRHSLPLMEALVLSCCLGAWAVAATFVQRRTRRRNEQVSARQKLEASLQRAVAMAETEDDLLEVAGQALAHVVPGSPAEVLIAAESGSEIHLAAIAPEGAPGCPVESAGACAAMRSGQTQRFVDVDALDICPRLRGRAGGPKPAVCVPLAVMGRTIGVVHATACGRAPFTEDEVTRLEGVASHFGARLRMLQMVDALQRQATTDALTGLPNRRFFEERAHRLLAGGTAVHVGIADLDHFKKLNDSHGHAIGDRALRIFGEVLRETFSQRSEIVARLGGEEFAIVVPRREGVDPRDVFDRLRANLEIALRSQGTPAFTASFGVASSPVHGSTLGDLLASADRALYNAKDRGRNRVVLFGEESDSATPTSMPRPISIVPAARATGGRARVRPVG